MPGQVVLVESKGSPSIPASQDFAVVGVGYSTHTPVAAGLVTPPYSSPQAFSADHGIGDGVDLVLQAITSTQGNPAPPPVCFVRTPASTEGSRGGTVTSTIASGRVTVTQTAGTHPVGVYEPSLRCTTAGRLGEEGIYLEYSPNGGRNWLPAQALGTAVTLKMSIRGVETGVQFDFAFAGLTGTADITAGGLYGAGGTLHGKTLKLDVNGGGESTLTLDGNTNTANKAALLAAIAVEWSDLTATDVSTFLHLADSDPIGSIVVGAGTANALLGLVAGDYGADFTEGDLIEETVTVGPQWAIGDLYTAGSPPTGALASIARSATALAIVALADPVQASDFPTLTAALNYLETRGKRVALFARFRSRTADETDAEHSLAFATFCQACSDDRIMISRGEGWLTEPFSGYRYMRSGLPAALARMQSFEATPGARGERMAQHPGWVARGPLEGFSIVDDAGQPLALAHDERETGGTEGPFAGYGGGMSFYYEREPSIRGTYIGDVPVRFAPLGQIVAWPDRRVVNGVKSVAAAELKQQINGAVVVDGLLLDAAIAEIQGGMVAGPIRDRYAREFVNAGDADLVVIDQVVTVDGAKVSETGVINLHLYGYTDRITVAISANRS